MPNPNLPALKSPTNPPFCLQEDKLPVQIMADS